MIEQQTDPLSMHTVVFLNWNSFDGCYDCAILFISLFLVPLFLSLSFPQDFVKLQCRNLWIGFILNLFRPIVIFTAVCLTHQVKL